LVYLTLMRHWTPITALGST